MNPQQESLEDILIAIDQLSQTVEVMSSVIHRLKGQIRHYEEQLLTATENPADESETLLLPDLH